MRALAMGSTNAVRLSETFATKLSSLTTHAVLHGLSEDEKEALSVDLYNRSFNPDNDIQGLYAWERTWFDRRLPRAPGRILVGAAGSGREALALLDEGYTVDAFEPSKRAYQHCASTLGKRASVWQGTYQDLVRAVLEDSAGPLPVDQTTRYDAILLGWGSIGHVLRSSHRQKLLAACDVLAPRGPILLSTFEPAASASGPQVFVPWGGFLENPTMEELAAHCTSLNRELVASYGQPTSFATLVPRRTSASVARTPQREQPTNAPRGTSDH